MGKVHLEAQLEGCPSALNVTKSAEGMDLLPRALVCVQVTPELYGLPHSKQRAQLSPANSLC